MGARHLHMVSRSTPSYEVISGVDVDKSSLAGHFTDKIGASFHQFTSSDVPRHGEHGPHRSVKPDRRRPLAFETGHSNRAGSGSHRRPC